MCSGGGSWCEEVVEGLLPRRRGCGRAAGRARALLGDREAARALCDRLLVLRRALAGCRVGGRDARLAGRAAFAKGPRSLKNRVSWPLDALRSWSAGFCSSATRPSAAIVGVTCSRKPGRRWKVPASAWRRAALADAAFLAASTHRPT